MFFIFNNLHIWVVLKPYLIFFFLPTINNSVMW